MSSLTAVVQAESKVHARNGVTRVHSPQGSGTQTESGIFPDSCLPQKIVAYAMTSMVLADSHMTHWSTDRFKGASELTRESTGQRGHHKALLDYRVSDDEVEYMVMTPIDTSGS